MKLSMLKLSIIILSSAVFLNAASKDGQRVVDFVKSSIQTNENFTLKDVKIHSFQNIENLENWKAYFLKISLYVKEENRNVDIDEIVFSDGKFFTKELFSLIANEDVKQLVAPAIKDNLHDKKHFIAGSLEAKTKLLVFSDPLCPFCVSFVPLIIDFVNKHPKDFGLYYYHLPLTTIHPHASTLIKAIKVAKKRGEKDVILRAYKQKFKNHRGKEEDVLKEFNKAFGLNITLDDIKDKAINEELEEDIKVAKNFMVRGTPTLFIDGKLDPKREKLLELMGQYEDKKK